MTSELQLELDGVLTDHTVEDGIFFFELSFSEDVLDNGVKNHLIDLVASISELVLIFIVVDSFLITFFLSLETSEQEASKLSELLGEIVWSNNIENKLDFLSLVFVSSDPGDLSLSELSKLSFLLIVLLLPSTSRVIVVVILSVLLGSTFSEIIALSLVVTLVIALTSTFVVLRVVLLHLGLSLDGFLNLSVNKGDVY